MSMDLSPVSKVIAGAFVLGSIVLVSMPLVSAGVGAEGVSHVADDIDIGLRKARLASVTAERTVRFTINKDCSWSVRIIGDSANLLGTSSLIHGLDCKTAIGGQSISQLDFKPEGYVYSQGRPVNQPVHIQITSKIIQAAGHGETILPSGLAFMDDKSS